MRSCQSWPSWSRPRRFSTFTHKCVLQSSKGLASSLQLCDPLNDLCNIIKEAAASVQRPNPTSPSPPPPLPSPSVEFLQRRAGPAERLPRRLASEAPLPRRVVPSTAALSNEFWGSPPASTASSLTWWRRWGHAEAALYPHKPTQVSCPLMLTGKLFHRGVRRGVSGPAPHCSTG